MKIWTNCSSFQTRCDFAILFIKAAQHGVGLLTFGAVVAGPLSPADALLQLQVELAVPGAVRQALPGLAVQLAAVEAAPALPAHARPGHAEPVAGARRIGAVGCKCRIGLGIRIMEILWRNT